MSSSKRMGILPRIVVGILGLCCLSACHRMPPPPSRILLIVMDGARFDVCTRRTMPNLYRFMADGTVFRRAYSPSSWTLPSHASLFTGVYPQQHGAFRLPYQPSGDPVEDTRRREGTEISVDDVSLPQGLPTLAGALSKAGYQTIGVFGNPCYGYPIFNLSQGFDRWINVVEDKLDATGATSRGFYAFDYEVDGRFYTVIPKAQEVARAVHDALDDADPSRPLFLFVNFEDPVATPMYYPPRQRPYVRAHYRRYLEWSMRRIDAQLPSILDQFKDGIVIVTADHGQGIGRRFTAADHASSLSPEQTHIPFLSRQLPLGTIGPDTPLDLTKVMPLILRAAGVPLPRDTTGKLSRLDRETGSPCPCAFAHLDPSPTNGIGRFARFAVYTRDGYLLLDRAVGGLTTSLAHRGAARREAFQLLQRQRALEHALLRFLTLGRVTPRTGRTQRLEQRNLEQLRQLGYIQ